MTRRLLEGVDGSLCRRAVRAATLLLALSAAFGAGASSARQNSARAPDVEQRAEVAGVKFASPREYRLEETSDPAVAFMRHPAHEVALFVAVPDGRVDDAYLSKLSDRLARQFLPRQGDVTWQMLGPAKGWKTSTSRIGSGSIKGLAGKRLVQIDYLVLKSQGRSAVVGSVATFGDERDAKFLFDVDGREYSFIGWQGLFQLVASITGANDN